MSTSGAHVTPPPRAELAASEFERMIGAVLDAGHRLHPDRLPLVVAEHAGRLGWRDVAVYVVDLSQRLLVPLNADELPRREPLEIDSTLAGRAFRNEQPIGGGVSRAADRSPATIDLVEEDEEEARRFWLPLIDGAERLGVLAITLDRVDEATLERCRHLATVVAELVVTKSAYGDGIVLARRLREVDLAAELRWAMLPPLTFASEEVVISGILEPAYEIAGDSFDYAINGDTVELAILDAMGHGLEASRMANLAVGSLRNSRRKHLDLHETTRVMDEVVAREFGPDRFLTGQLATLKLSTGELQWLNAGHPAPLLLRGGQTADLTAEIRLPIGLTGERTQLATTALEPNDAVLFFSDGVTEARAPDGELFGRARLADLWVRASASGATPAETMRRLCHAVLDHEAASLRDDATLLLLQWLGRLPSV
jgi:hypothetical protein